VEEVDTAVSSLTPVSKLPTQTNESRSLIPPVTNTETTVTHETTTVVGRLPWLSANLRNLLIVLLVSMVCWMAYKGNEQAEAALIAAFSVLVGMLFGERAALKRPGQDS
jgi:hypothetical protein